MDSTHDTVPPVAADPAQARTPPARGTGFWSAAADGLKWLAPPLAALIATYVLLYVRL